MASAADFGADDPIDHARKKDMWGGALLPVENPNLFGCIVQKSDADEKKSTLVVVQLKVPQTSALLKAFDEYIVNTSDLHKELMVAKGKEQVTAVDIKFIKGIFSIHNNGRGFPVEPVTQQVQKTLKVDDGHTVYCPELAYAYLFAGTNLDKKEESTKGGTNGIGAKLGSVHAKRVEIITVDAKRKKHYRQEILNRRYDVRPPVITAMSPTDTPGTRVTMEPDYAALKYKGEAHLPEIDAWLRLRAHQHAAYLGPRVRVTYNGVVCATTTAAALARLMCPEGTIVPLTAKSKESAYKPHVWDIAAIVVDKPPKTLYNLAIVNGVISNAGNHVTYYRSLISDAVVEKLNAATKKGKGKKAKTATDEKKLGVADTMKGVRLVMCGALPGARWDSQTKDKMVVPLAALKHYEVPATALKQLAAVVADQVLTKVTGGKRAKHIEKYQKAAHAGKAARRQCALIAAEGDSALRMLKSGLAQNKTAKRPPGCASTYVVPNRDYCGTVTLGGVIPNAAKEVTEHETGEGESLLVRSDKIRKNEKLAGLAAALGLVEGCSYTDPRDMDKLDYGAIIACTDQDLDGTGKILTLLLTYFFIFHPGLITGGFFRRFLTPVVRMYPKASKGEPLEFHYEPEATQFMEKNPDWEARYHKPRFIKGLAGHRDAEVKKMFRPEAFNKSVYTFTLDDAAKALWAIYNGADGAARKAYLRTPVQYLSYAEAQAIHRSRLIPCAVHLSVDTKALKQEMILRQIPNAVDGLVPASRKVVDGAIELFGTKNKERKVYQAAAAVALLRHYHHGEASLNATVIGLAQAFRDQRQLPLLLGHGSFGTRHLAGKDAGSSRYISVSLCPLARALYPAANRWLLHFVFEDGERSEPRHLVPVLPMAVLDVGSSRPSEGWAHTSHSRDYAAVLGVVQKLLEGDAVLCALADRLHAAADIKDFKEVLGDISKLPPLPVSTRDYKGEVKPYKGVPHSFGDYTWDAATRTITVTELPLGVPTGGDEKKCPGFLCSLEKSRKTGEDTKISAHIESVDDLSSDADVDVRIKLKAGAFEQIEKKYGTGGAGGGCDAIEDFLKLRESLACNLNYVGKDGTVVEFGQNYLAVLLYWFPVCRDLYAARLRRDETLCVLQILEHEQILRYCGMYDTLGLKKYDDEKASAILTEKKFPKLDSALLHSPKFTLVDKIADLVQHGPKVSHAYLLDLTDRAKLTPAVKKRQEKLAELRKSLIETRKQLAEKPFPGVSLWRADIAACDKIIQKGFTTRWTFEREIVDDNDEDDVKEDTA